VVTGDILANRVAARVFLRVPFTGYDTFPLSVPLFQITHRLGDLAEQVRSVEDRCQLPGLKEPLQDGHLEKIY
jgi:hypothetical protein